MMDQEIRKQGIGGSEVAAILGLSPYSSPYKVWLDKTGRESSSVDNKYTKAGLILESAVADYFEQATQYRIIKASAKQKTIVHPKYEFVIGTPDRMYFTQQKVGRGILECKTTQYSHDDIPESWFIQLQWYLGIAASGFGSIAWLEHGLDFKYKKYEYDREFFEYLVDTVAVFWNDNVIKDVPPEPINTADIERMFSRHTEEKILHATPEMEAAHKELTELRESIKALETREKELADSVKLSMRDAGMVVSNEKPLFTWKSIKGFLQFDKDRFRADYPALYEEYLKMTEGSRRFLVK